MRDFVLIYHKVEMRWEQDGEQIRLYRVPAYPDRGKEELAFFGRF